MSYDEEQHRRSRVVVETPTARREVVQTQVARVPEHRGYSTGVIAAVALTAIAVTAIVMLFLMNNREDATNTNVSVATQPTPVVQQTPIIIQQPVTQPSPVIIQQTAPPPTTTQPVIITPPPPSTTTTVPSPTSPAGVGTSTAKGTDDATLQLNLSKKFDDDPQFSGLDITATIMNGKATLIGSVKTPELKRRAEQIALSVKGVRSVDNQIIVEGGLDSATPPE